MINKEQEKRIKNLIQIQKGLIKKKQKLADFKEPIGFLIKRDYTIEFHEGLKTGKFYFNHSDGDRRHIELTGKIHTLDYAGRKVRVYILHEDFPTPLPEEPINTTETIAIAQEKLAHDINKFRLQEAKIKSGVTVKIILAIAGLIAVIALATSIVPQSFWDKVFPPKPEATKPLLDSISIFILLTKIKWNTKNC